MSYPLISTSDLRVWRDGIGKSGQKPELDIIAVHGLSPTSRSDHAESTWTWEDGTCWLTHKKFLPKKLPTARILCYSYNSALFCVGSSIFDQAKDLVERLHSERSGEHGDPQRPLLFIAHSLGGLLVKAALIAAVTAEGDIYGDLATCPKGLATFGTPHRGSIYATLLNLTTDLFRPFGTLGVLLGDEPRSPEGYRNILKQGDDTSYIIGTQFLDRYKSAIPITSFYEMEPFHYKKILGKVVNERSATLKDPDRKFNHRERRVGLNADHNDIVRFPYANRGLGRAVLAEIKRLADEVLASGSTRGLASGSTETGTDGGASGPSQSAPASWQEGSVQYFGDSRDDTETQQDKSMKSTDDRIDTEMLEAKFKNKLKLSSTSYLGRGKASSFDPNVRPHKPSNTHAMPECATRSFCFDCESSRNHKCPEHCKDCQNKRSDPSSISNRLGKYKDKPSSIIVRKYWEKDELCRQHEIQWCRFPPPPIPFFSLFSDGCKSSVQVSDISSERPTSFY